MKAKLKFDTAVVKNFFADHWEKFIVAGSIIVLLFFIVSVFKRETLPSSLQPNQIVLKTSTLKSATDGSEWVEPTDLSLKPTEVPGAIAPLPAGQLSEIPEFIRGENRVFEDPNKRTDPTLLPVLALQATAGRGGLATGVGPGLGAGVGPIGAGTRPMIDQSAPRSRSGPSSGPAPSPATPAPRSTRGRVATPAPAVPPRTPGRSVLGQQQPLVGETGSPPIPAEFELPGAPGGGSAESRHFVIVTGAIPVLDQLKEYDRRFSHARHSEAESAVNFNGPRGPSGSGDVPVYVWWRLLRVDLTNGEEKIVIDYGNVDQVRADRNDQSIGVNLVMKSLKPSNKFVALDKELAQWQGSGAEVVPDAYLADPWLSWPLPPILLRDWGREATNPKIPLTPPQATGTPDAATPSAEPGATKPADSSDPFSKPASDDRPTAAPRSAPFVGRSGPAFDPSRPSSGPRGLFQPRGPDRSAPRGFPARGPAAIGGQADAGALQVPFRLFRFVDFDVEPGHSYQYRVQLVLKNPNFGMASELLAKPDPKPAPYRETPWSEASRPATVPFDTQIVAEAVDRPKRGEPKVKAGVLQWDKKDSVELIAKADLQLGEVANFIQKKLVGVVDPVNRAIRDFTADFISDGALLDMHGGGDEKTAVDGGGPGELLFLVVGRDGKADQLVVVNQALDKPLIDGWDKTHKVPPEMLNATDASPNFLGRSGPASSGSTPLGGLLGRGPASSRESKTPAPKSGVPGK